MSIDTNSISSGIGSAANLGKNERSKLEKACREFEALFVAQMLKVMRQTTESEVGGLSLGAGNPFQDMFDWELAVRLSERSPLGVAGTLLRQWREHQESSQINPKSALPSNSAARPKAPAARTEASDKTQISSTPKAVSQDIDNIIQRAAKRYDLDPNLVRAVIACESGFDAAAVSPKGAKGLMQLIDSTATDLGVNDPFDAEANVFGGTSYLRQLWDRYQGDPKLALAAYNAGPGAVDRFRGVPPYAETTAYVRKVLNAWKDQSATKNQ
ncbi:MAG: transglycosylase SLT domain-containing protein [Calditrichota bacterium]